MVGLSVILENYKDLAAKRSPQVINKGSMIKPLSSPTSPLSFSCFSPGNNNNKNNNNKNVSSSNISSTCGFLEICFLCKEKLKPGKDIYMYKGDRAFCSVECRCRQILMDEEETTTTTAAKSSCTREYNCSLGATSSSPSSSSSRRNSVNNKGTRNRANYNGFAY